MYCCVILYVINSLNAIFLNCLILFGIEQVNCPFCVSSGIKLSFVSKHWILDESEHPLADGDSVHQSSSDRPVKRPDLHVSAVVEAVDLSEHVVCLVVRPRDSEHSLRDSIQERAFVVDTCVVRLHLLHTVQFLAELEAARDVLKLLGEFLHIQPIKHLECGHTNNHKVTTPEMKKSFSQQQELVLKIQKMFMDKHPKINLLDEHNNYNEFEFFSQYYKTYKTTGTLITSQADRKAFIDIMNKYFLDYFMNQLISRVESGQDRKAVEKELEKTAAEYLPYIMVKKLV